MKAALPPAVLAQQVLCPRNVEQGMFQVEACKLYSWRYALQELDMTKEMVVPDQE